MPEFNMADTLKYSSLQSELIATLRILNFLAEEQLRIEAELHKLKATK